MKLVLEIPSTDHRPESLVTGAREHPGVSGFSVLTGSELLVDSALAVGADGAVPGLANVDPDGHRLEAVIDTPPVMGSDPG